MKQLLVFLLLCLSAAVADAAQIVPTVYQDQYIMARAAINEAGRRPIHLGDLLSLELRVQFDSRNVRVEQFDSEYFQHAFSSQPGIRLFAAPTVKHEDLDDGKVETRAIWLFQSLDCPAEQEQCGGSKSYELPVISTSYQLIDKSGQVLNDRSFRFRPWPGKLAVVPALPSAAEIKGSFADYFPAGAYPEMFPVGEPVFGGLLAVLAGGLILAFSFGNRFSAAGKFHSLQKTRPAARRWERLLLQLQDSSLPDEQWADGLRRCASWFCLDEMHVNPYVWLTDESAAAMTLSKPTAGARALFTDIATQGDIELENRQDYLARFTRMVDEIIDAKDTGEER